MPCFAGIDKCKLSLQDFSLECKEIKNLKYDSTCNLKISIDGKLLSLDIKSEFSGKSLFLLMNQILKHRTVTLN